MGLDTVELVLAVEKEFGIDIPDSDAGRIFTVGELHTFVISELGRIGRPLESGDVYEQLRALISHHLGVRPEAVVPEARFVKDLGAD